MRVSGLDENGDWKFGRGKASYLLKAEAVRQNVSTRLKSFQNDWFLDTTANIDWITLLGSRNQTIAIEREVERVVLETEGVARIDRLEFIEDRELRSAIIRLKITTIFDTQFTDDIGITP